MHGVCVCSVYTTSWGNHLIKNFIQACQVSQLMLDSTRFVSLRKTITCLFLLPLELLGSLLANLLNYTDAALLEAQGPARK